MDCQAQIAEVCLLAVVSPKQTKLTLCVQGVVLASLIKDYTLDVSKVAWGRVRAISKDQIPHNFRLLLVVGVRHIIDQLDLQATYPGV